MQVEDVAGVGLAPGRTPQQQGDLAVGPGLLGEVVVDDQGVLAAVPEVLAHGAAGIGGDELQGGGIGGVGRDHDGVAQGVLLLQLGHHLGHRGGLLAHRHVDADDVGVFLVDDGVHRHRGLAGLAVADDQLPLAPADGHHGVDGLDAGLHRLVHRLPPDDARSDLLDGLVGGGFDGSLAVDGLAEGVDHPADQALAHGHLHDAAGGLDGVAFADVGVVSEDHGAHGVALEVQGHAEDAARELEHLPLHDVLDAVGLDDAVLDGHHRALAAGLQVLLEALYLLADQVADL